MTIRIVGGTRGVYEDDDGQDVAGVRVAQVDSSETANSTGTKTIASLTAFASSLAHVVLSFSFMQGPDVASVNAARMVKAEEAWVKAIHSSAITQPALPTQ